MVIPFFISNEFASLLSDNFELYSSLDVLVALYACLENTKLLD